MSVIPKQLRNDKFRFILLKGRTKIPLEEKWQRENNYRWDDKKLEQHIKSGNNYGVCGGFGELVIVDFDTKEQYERIKDKLPQTFVVQSGGGLPHYYYYVNDG